MTDGPPRAVFALLCVFGVVLGATLFPATMFGTNPVPADQGGNDTVPDGDQTTETISDGPNATTTARTDDTTGSTTENNPSTTVNTDTGTATVEATEAVAGTTTSPSTTTTPTTTTAAAGGDDGSDGGLAASVLTLLTILASGVAGIVGVATGFGRHHRRRHPDEWDLPDAPHLRLLAYVRRVPQTSLSFVLYTGAHTPTIFESFGNGFATVSTGLRAMFRGFGRVGRLAATSTVALPVGIIRGIGGVARGIGSLSLGLSSLFSGFGGSSILTGTGGDRPTADPRRGGGNGAETEDPSPPDPPDSVREAWARLQADLGIGGGDGKTPRQIGRAAVDRGVPRDAIRSLTRSFREVRYGGFPDDGERVASARTAYTRIRTALERDSS